MKANFKTRFARAGGAVMFGLYEAGVRLHRRLYPSGKAARSNKRRRRVEIAFLSLILFFPVAHFLVFYVGVNFNSILLAFQKYDPDTGRYLMTGGENFEMLFRDLFRDTSMKIIVKNSFVAYFAGLIVGMPLNLFFAYVIYKKLPGAAFFQIVLFLPSILSSIVMSLMFQQFVDNVLPILCRAVGIKGEINLLFNVRTAFPTQVFYTLWVGFGSALILYVGAMTRIPDSIVEFGQLEGIKLSREFFSVVLPMIYGTITVFLVTGISGIFVSQLSLYNFYGSAASSSIQTLGYYFFVKVVGAQSTLSDYPYAAAGGLVFTLVAAPVTLLARYLLEKFGPNVET